MGLWKNTLIFLAVTDPGEGPGGPDTPLSLDQNEAWRVEKFFLGGGDRAPPYLRVWMPPSPPPYLKVWIRHCLGVRFRFYIDFEVSLVDKRFKGFRDREIIIRRGSWKWACHRVILRGAPADLHLHVLSLYCTVTFFDGCVCRITSKLRSEAKPTISEKSDCPSSLEFSCESLDWSFESLCFITPSSSPGWVMIRKNKTQNAS